MIFDKSLEFDPASTVIAVTTVSTNVIDLQGAGLLPAPGSSVKPGRDIGGGTDGGSVPRIWVFVDTTFTAGGGATLNIQFQGAPDNGSGAPGFYVTYAETGAIALASLVAGNVLWDVPVPRVLPVPVSLTSIPRFVELNYVVASGPFTGGALRAYIALPDSPSAYYPSGIAVAN